MICGLASTRTPLSKNVACTCLSRSTCKSLGRNDEVPSSKVRAMRLAQLLSICGSPFLATSESAPAVTIRSRSAVDSRRSRTKSPVTCRTCATKASWFANGSALQIASSSVHPSARSGFATPESTPGAGGAKATVRSADHPYGHASRTGMLSAARAVRTVAVLTTRSGTSAATSTTIRIGGYAAWRGRASERVQAVVVRPPGAVVPAVQTQPAPAIAVTVRPAGTVSVTVTGPRTADPPRFETVTVSNAATMPGRQLDGACSKATVSPDDVLPVAGCGGPEIGRAHV